MKATFDQHIGIFENAVPKEFCNKIINLFNSLPPEGVNNRPIGIPSTLMEDTSTGLQYYKPELCEEFATNFSENIYPLYSKKYKLDNDILGFPMSIFDFKVQKTSPTEGYHVWHIEHGPHVSDAQNRIMAYTLYLNDIEEGGETEFLIQSLRVKPKQGTLVLWPAGYTHIHRGNPPLSKDKYIITGWLEYNPNP